VDTSRKIMWNTFFAFSYDFSMALALLKRALTFFAAIIFMLSYYHAWRLYAKEFDQASACLYDVPFKGLSLDNVMEGLMLSCALVIMRPHNLGALCI